MWIMKGDGNTYVHGGDDMAWSADPVTAGWMRKRLTGSFLATPLGPQITAEQAGPAGVFMAAQEILSSPTLVAGVPPKLTIAGTQVPEGAVS